MSGAQCQVRPNYFHHEPLTVQLLTTGTECQPFSALKRHLLAHPVKARNSSRLGKLRLMPVPLKVPQNVCTLFGILSRSTPSPEEVIPEHPAKCSSRSSKLEGKPAAMADRPVSVSFTQPMKSKYNLRSPWQKCDLG